MQSNVIFGFIFVAYIFYITAKGELATYLDILRGGGQQVSPAAQTAAAQSSGLIDAGQIINSDGTASDATSFLSNPAVLSAAAQAR